MGFVEQWAEGATAKRSGLSPEDNPYDLVSEREKALNWTTGFETSSIQLQPYVGKVLKRRVPVGEIENRTMFRYRDRLFLKAGDTVSVGRFMSEFDDMGLDHDYCFAVQRLFDGGEDQIYESELVRGEVHVLPSDFDPLVIETANRAAWMVNAGELALDRVIEKVVHKDTSQRSL